MHDQSEMEEEGWWVEVENHLVEDVDTEDEELELEANDVVAAMILEAASEEDWVQTNCAGERIKVKINCDWKYDDINMICDTNHKVLEERTLPSCAVWWRIYVTNRSDSAGDNPHILLIFMKAHSHSLSL